MQARGQSVSIVQRSPMWTVPRRHPRVTPRDGPASAQSTLIVELSTGSGRGRREALASGARTDQDAEQPRRSTSATRRRTGASSTTRRQHAPARPRRTTARPPRSSAASRPRGTRPGREGVAGGRRRPRGRKAELLADREGSSRTGRAAGRIGGQVGVQGVAGEQQAAAGPANARRPSVAAEAGAPGERTRPRGPSRGRPGARASGGKGPSKTARKEPPRAPRVA